jgi:hypothetical protein
MQLLFFFLVLFIHLLGGGDPSAPQAHGICDNFGPVKNPL